MKVNAIAPKNLSFAIHTNETAGSIVVRGNENCVATDSVHVDARPSFQVVQMNEAILCHQKNDVIFLANLHCHGKVVQGFWWEKHIHRSLGKHWSTFLVIDFNNVQLQFREYETQEKYFSSSSGSGGKCEKFCGGGGSIQLELSKSGCMTFNRLRYRALNRVQLHRSNHASLLTPLSIEMAEENLKL